MASGEISIQHTRALSETFIEPNHHHEQQQKSNQLLHLLSNSLVLDQTLPYLPVSALLNLAATNRSYRAFVHHTPGVFRHLDLTQCKRARSHDLDGNSIDRGGEVWRNEQVDENLTEDDFYSGPLRAIFRSLERQRTFESGDDNGSTGTVNLLAGVRTLVLDGLSAVTAELVHDVITNTDGSFHVRILSVRECKNLNENKLMQTLKYACRPSRPDDTPTLEGLYVFAKKDAPLHSAAPPSSTDANTTPGVNNSRNTSIGSNWNNRSQHALHSHNYNQNKPQPQQQQAATAAAAVDEGDDWYHKRPSIVSRGNTPLARAWAETLLRCRGLIRFDAPLCSGPAHRNSPAYGALPHHPLHEGSGAPMIATFAVGGCATCGVSPEGFTVYDESKGEEERAGGLPLLAPVPAGSSSAKVACRPSKCTSAPPRGSVKKSPVPVVAGGHHHGGNGQHLRHHHQHRQEQQQQQRQHNNQQQQRFVPRCLACIRERYCFSCDQWWCEACYQVPTQHELSQQAQQQAAQVQILNSDASMTGLDGMSDDGLLAHEMAAQAAEPKIKTRKITRSCWECDLNCDTCIADTQKICRGCGGGYCIVHYEGSTQTLCDWCSTRRGRRYRGDLY